MFTLLNLVLKYIEKFLIITVYASIPFVFIIIFWYLNTKTSDTHIIFVLTTSLIIFFNINILYFILVNKVNEILKILKKNKNEKRGDS